MAARAGDQYGFLRGVYEGCISGNDMGIERRPYHKNCDCALHKSRKQCSHTMNGGPNISYPIRRSWSEGCLALAASVHSSPSSSPAAILVKNSSQLSLCREQEEEGNISIKV
ncbi:hypothetical protein RJ641_027611 [Dillenia turbinata]|uniref:Uncharacterized protein n=1 Tax=Dillenia turbinata TaxID=194707 RepID=A0AAN8VXR8_9MAGN